MSEENNTEEVQYTEVEQKAMSRGWKPEDQYEGDDWVDAKTFVKNGELMDTISTLNKKDKQREDKINQLEEALKTLGEHNKKIAVKEYEKAMADLKRQKARALDLDDSEKVVEIDDQISDLKESKKALDESEQAAPAPQKASGPHPDFITWVNSNPWYRDNVAMRGAADAFAREYVRVNPAAKSNPAEVLAHVELKVKETFEMKPQGRPAAVAEASGEARSKATAKGKVSAKLLSEELRRVGQTLVKAGAFDSLDDYAKQLAELGEL